MLFFVPFFNFLFSFLFLFFFFFGFSFFLLLTLPLLYDVNPMFHIAIDFSSFNSQISLKSTLVYSHFFYIHFRCVFAFYRVLFEPCYVLFQMFLHSYLNFLSRYFFASLIFSFNRCFELSIHFIAIIFVY